MKKYSERRDENIKLQYLEKDYKDPKFIASDWLHGCAPQCQKKICDTPKETGDNRQVPSNINASRNIPI